MRRALTLTVAAVAALAIGYGITQAEENKPLTIGGICPNFTGLQSADGKSYSLADFKDKDVLVICVTCNHCPFAVAVEDRNIEFCKKFCGADGKCAFIAVCVNLEDADTLDKLKERSKEKGMNYPYACDPTQSIGKALGAKQTPEYFVFDKNRKLVYHGALDDQQKNLKAEAVKDAFVALAVEAALKGEMPVTQESKPTGCGIRYQSK